MAFYITSQFLFSSVLFACMFFFLNSYFGRGCLKNIFLLRLGVPKVKLCSLDYRKVENNKEYKEVCKIFHCCFFFHVTNLINVLFMATRLQQSLTDSVHLVKITFIIVITLNPCHLVMFALFYFPFSLFLSFDVAR